MPLFYTLSPSVRCLAGTLFWIAIAAFGPIGKTATAQGLCNNPVAKGSFTVNKTRLCEGTSVVVTTGTSVTNVGYKYDYKGGDWDEFKQPGGGLVTATSFRYDTPGSYTIIQVGSGGGFSTGTIACQAIEVLPVRAITYTVKLCSGRRALLDAKLDAYTNKYDTYRIDWGDGTIENKTQTDLQAKPIHTYNRNGRFVVTVVGLYNPPVNCQGAAPDIPALINVTGPDVGIPVISRISTENGTVSIQYQASGGVGVRLFQLTTQGASEVVGTSTTLGGTFTVPATNQPQCFRVASVDGCDNPRNPSPLVCSEVLTAKASDRQNNLNWAAYGGDVVAQPFSFYRIYRNNVPVNLVTSIATTAYADTNNIQCGEPYCYQLEVQSGPTTILSNPVCVTGINNQKPNSFTNVLASVSGNAVQLTAPLPTQTTPGTYTVLISRSMGASGTYSLLAERQDGSFTDTTAQTQMASYCYQLTYRNACGVLSDPSAPVCSIWLSSSTGTSLDWTTDLPFTPGPARTYALEVTGLSGGTQTVTLPTGSSQYLPDGANPLFQAAQYRVVATSADGQVSYSNSFTLILASTIFMPDAFSPNSDNVNDVLAIKGGYGLKTFRMTILDRWGTVIFVSTDPREGWDGRIGAEPAMQGNYLYRIESEDMNGKKTVRTGAVLLIR